MLIVAVRFLRAVWEKNPGKEPGFGAIPKRFDPKMYECVTSAVNAQKQGKIERS